MRQHRRVCRRHERLARLADASGEDPPAARVELGEDVVEQEQRRRAAAVEDHLGLGEKQREHGEALLSL